MNFIIMDVTRHSAIYNFSAIIINHSFHIVEKFNKEGEGPEIGLVIKKYIQDLLTSRPNSLGLFFSRKIKSEFRKLIDMKSLSRQEKIFLFDAGTLRDEFSEILFYNNLRFDTFFKLHNIPMMRTDNSAHENVDKIYEVLTQYPEPQSILMKCINKERVVQLNRAKEITKQKRHA